MTEINENNPLSLEQMEEIGKCVNRIREIRGEEELDIVLMPYREQYAVGTEPQYAMAPIEIPQYHNGTHSDDVRSVWTVSCVREVSKDGYVIRHSTRDYDNYGFHLFTGKLFVNWDGRWIEGDKVDPVLDTGHLHIAYPDPDNPGYETEVIFEGTLADALKQYQYPMTQISIYDPFE